MLSREQILAAQDLLFEEIEVPEWGGTVRIKVMSGTDRDAFETQVRDRVKLGQLGENLRALMVACSVVDEGGKLLFGAADIEALGAKSWMALDRVVMASAKLNRLTDAELEATVKN